MPTNFLDDKLAASGLVQADLDAKQEVDFNGNPNGFRIPYYRPDGTLHSGMYRIRLENPAPTQGKYTQPATNDLVTRGHPASDATHPYLNPHMWGGATWEALGKVSGKRMLIVEGELKAASAMKLLGMAAIGIPGCDGGVVKDVRGVASVHPVIRTLIQPGDAVEVVFDGDVRTNPNVERAAGTLKRALARLGVRAVFVLLPIPARGAGGGLDDWLVAQVPADRRQAFAALPRTYGTDFAEDKTSVADYFGLSINPKTGMAVPTTANLRRLMDRHERYASTYFFDVMRGNLYRNERTGPVPMVDSHAFDERVWLQDHIGITIGKMEALDCLRWMAEQPKWRRNLLIESLPVWDGVLRQELMFVHGWGVPDSPYIRGVGRNWLTSAVARAMTPGSKVDTMLVMVGPQGIGKSRSLELIGSGFYLQTHAQAHDKDFILALHRGWLIDMAELSSMNHADASQIKGVISTATDHIRPPYGAATVEMKRHSVIVGTTNEERFLRDQTGNRRFWPVACGTIDLSWIEANRLQLLAEAKARVDAGETWWDMPASTAAVQEARMEISQWDAPVSVLLASPHNMRIIDVGGAKFRYITNEEILDTLVELRFRKPHHYRDLAATMRRVGGVWERYQCQQQIVLQGGGTLPVSRGYRAPVTGNPSAVVVPIKKF